MPLDLRKLVGEARPFSYAAGVCLVALALCFELFLSKLTGSSPSTTFFAVSIAVSAWYGGAGPGILALILSAAAIDYLVVVPGSFLHFSNIGEPVLFACYIIGWFGFCLLTERTYRILRRDRNLRRIEQNENAFRAGGARDDGKAGPRRYALSSNARTRGGAESRRLERMQDDP